MIVCENCKNEYSEEYLYCPKCGKKHNTVPLFKKVSDILFPFLIIILSFIMLFSPVFSIDLDSVSISSIENYSFITFLDSSKFKHLGDAEIIISNFTVFGKRIVIAAIAIIAICLSYGTYCVVKALFDYNNNLEKNIKTAAVLAFISYVVCYLFFNNFCYSALGSGKITIDKVLYEVIVTRISIPIIFMIFIGAILIFYTIMNIITHKKLLRLKKYKMITLISAIGIILFFIAFFTLNSNFVGVTYIDKANKEHTEWIKFCHTYLLDTNLSIKLYWHLTLISYIVSSILLSILVNSLVQFNSKYNETLIKIYKIFIYSFISIYALNYIVLYLGSSDIMSSLRSVSNGGIPFFSAGFFIGFIFFIGSAVCAYLTSINIPIATKKG